MENASTNDCYLARNMEVEQCSGGITHCRTLEVWEQKDKNSRSIFIERGCRLSPVCLVEGGIVPRYVCKDCRGGLCNGDN